MDQKNSPTKPAAQSLLRSNGLILGLVGFSFILSALPVVHWALLPFDFFTTLIHELGHTVASLITGGSVSKIVINPDTSGYMQHTGSDGAFVRSFIASAGYVGAALFGGFLIVVSALRNFARIALAGLAILFGVVTAFYVRDIFTFVVFAVLIAVLFLIAYKGSDSVTYFAINFLAVQCALNSIQDIVILIKLSLGAQKSAYSLGHSDADAVAEMLFLPPLFWSILWIAISGIILYFAMKKSSRIRAKAAEIGQSSAKLEGNAS